MKKIGIFFFLMLLSACNSENAPDCFQSTGNPVEREYDLPPFSEIMVYEGVKLYLTYDSTQNLIVKTGKNLLEEVSIKVEANKLIIKNENSCNMLRDYGEVEVFVTSPNLTLIQNGGSFTIKSTTVLPYPNLELIAENDGNEGQYHTDGVFDLKLDCENLKVVANGFSYFKLSGETENLFVGFYSSDGRLETGNLIAQHIEFFHRSSNQLFLNPQQSLKGEIRSTGDVISLNKPPIVEVEEFYTGSLIFR
ncbi:MAG TPA: head GIN domain-containing protein [Flavobacteriaceae bacterium]|nr:head GIN domain-containing protein [Flavobacteriaceae bacterium]